MAILHQSKIIVNRANSVKSISDKNKKPGQVTGFLKFFIVRIQ